jgi:hypothetical protein
MLIKGDNFAVEGRGFGGQRFQAIDQLGVVVAEICSIARKKPNFLAAFKSEGSVAVESEFVDPIAGRKLVH